MLPTINRLRKKKDFAKVYQRGYSYSSLLLWLKLLPNDLSYNRVGIVVSTKVSKKAVERNRIKRRLRALIKDYLSSIKPGYDIIITARVRIIDKSFQEIDQDLKSLLQRAQLL